jgi:shikimate kinase
MKNIYLIGMMGCGKTTCGKLLSRELGWPFLDTDQAIEEAQGRSVREIFSENGEEYFRELETQLCRDLSQKENLVVACGGGLPLREENRKILRDSGTVVFLNRDPAEIYDTGDMSARPLAQQGREAFLQRFAQRPPIYQAAAHVTIGSFSTPGETLAAIRTTLEV